MPKVKAAKSSKALRHNPLAEQILEDGNTGLRKTPRVKRGVKADDEEEDGAVIPSNVTRRLLQVAQAQKAEDRRDEHVDLEDIEDAPGEIVDDDEELDLEVDEEGFIVTQDPTDDDERALALFMPSAGGRGSAAPGPTLADVILQKIQEKEEQRLHGQETASAAGEPSLSPKVVEVYKDIGKWLRHYKSGKIPKAFKVIPSLSNWEEVLALTSPLNWSPGAMYEAVKIFASNLNPRMAQRFYNLVLLPAVRQNIAEYRKLNFHYYRSLKKSLFKPAAFFKGIVLPLATESCTLREAMILSSVLSKASIPVMHSAATLVRLCTMTPWYGTTSIIMAALINKKYALPFRVIECLVTHFAAFAAESRLLPVVWHRALLAFVQRYKFDLDEDQRRRLRELLRIHLHEAIGPEIRRELAAPKPGEGPSMSETGSAAMDL